MVGVLSSLSDTLAETVAATGPSVVRVDARSRLPASGVVWSADGVIVTAHHVVQHDEKISVALPDGETVPAALAGRDPSTDLAVLRAETKGLTTPTWAEASDLRVGHLVLALGRPGKSVRATLGIVSVLGESWRTPVGGRLDRYLQTDVVMYPGFSGGPLVDVSGQVLGLNTSAMVRGASVTVPTSNVRQVVETLLAHGRVRRGYLGVSAQAVPLPAALAKQLDQETGLLLVTIEAGSPAERGGLLLGDTIVAMAGEPVRHLDDLLSGLTADRIDAAVPIQVVRGGQAQDLSVTIGERK